MYVGPLPIVGITSPVAPSISADGLSIVVEGIAGAGPATLHQLTRATRSDAFADPVSLVAGMPFHEPGLDVTGLYMVMSDELYRDIMIATRITPDAVFSGGRVVTELSAYVPRYPALSADALTVAFVMFDDIALAHRETLANNFDGPVLLDAINTSYQEHDPWITYDTSAVYFTSDRVGFPGNWDIYVSRLVCR